MTRFILAALGTSVLFTGAVFGLFFAWVSTVMWGFDAADPRVAIPAMQAVNANVRNATFGTVFFGAPIVLLATAALLAWIGARRSASWTLLAAAVFVFGTLAPTFLVNVPMNEALATIAVPRDPTAAAQVWADFSGPWQVWNGLRTAMAGLALLGVVAAFVALPGGRVPARGGDWRKGDATPGHAC
ncbi:DUF1772 domain-containing protein [Jannaschia sp. S6380]|uniref:anthrone oxygenase family protein n=1 Tax=Jannaschia sp. S6380 TaxID=2926408 RepID=UPI001FF1F0D2|nr:anthrone oxygenase family protein [Jannaschia sp. S6380]MCK0166128.1 DUF1772 domain-containing protein [Jannaschia sp. S6380]